MTGACLDIESSSFSSSSVTRHRRYGLAYDAETIRRLPYKPSLGGVRRSVVSHEEHILHAIA